MRDAVERIVHPPQRADVDSAAQRAEMHDRLTKQAFAANAAGDTAEAASLFAQASGFDPRPTTILSHVNMRLKLGEYELAAACYERLLAGGTLSDKARAVAQAKRADADAAVAEQRRRDLAAATLGRAGRRVSARRRANLVAAAAIVQRCVLRRLSGASGRGPPPLVGHVAVMSTNSSEVLDSVPQL